MGGSTNAEVETEGKDPTNTKQANPAVSNMHTYKSTTKDPDLSELKRLEETRAL